MVRDRLQQFITTVVRFWVAYGGDGVEVRTMAVSTNKDDGCEYKCCQAMKSINEVGNR
jgi:hypothetical protein